MTELSPPSRIWYLIAIMILLLGPILGAVTTYRGIIQQPTDSITLQAPGVNQIQIKQPGSYILWTKPEKTTTERFKRIITLQKDDFGLFQIQDISSGSTIAFNPASEQLKLLKVQGRIPLGHVNLPRKGKYTITVKGDFPKTQLTLNHFSVSAIASRILRGIAIAVCSIIAAILIISITFIKRSNALYALEEEDNGRERNATAGTTANDEAQAERMAQPFIDQHEKRGRIWAMLCHAGTLLVFVIPLSNFIVPLVIWIAHRDEYSLVKDQGKESLNFQISLFIYYVCSVLLIIVAIGLLLFPLLILFQLIATIIASIEAASGKRFRYPLTLRFLK